MTQGIREKNNIDIRLKKKGFYKNGNKNYYNPEMKLSINFSQTIIRGTGYSLRKKGIEIFFSNKMSDMEQYIEQEIK